MPWRSMPEESGEEGIPFASLDDGAFQEARAPPPLLLICAPGWATSTVQATSRPDVPKFPANDPLKPSGDAKDVPLSIANRGLVSSRLEPARHSFPLIEFAILHQSRKLATPQRRRGGGRRRAAHPGCYLFVLRPALAASKGTARETSHSHGSWNIKITSKLPYQQNVQRAALWGSKINSCGFATPPLFFFLWHFIANAESCAHDRWFETPKHPGKMAGNVSMCVLLFIFVQFLPWLPPLPLK